MPTTRTPSRTRRGVGVLTRAAGQYPDADYIAKVQAEFASNGHERVATAEEGRCLWDDGYVILDVRAPCEIEFMGKCPNPPAPGQSKGDCVTVVPLVHAQRRYDAASGKKVYVQTPNDQFLREAQRAFPDTSSKLLVVCSDGRLRATAALALLRGAGYTGAVGMEGGCTLWCREWDQHLRRRNLPGKFSRGFDSPMFVDSNVVAESFGGDDWRDDVQWMVPDAGVC